MSVEFLALGRSWRTLFWCWPSLGLYRQALHPAFLSSSGNDHLVMLTTDGDLYTLGCGEQGQLGRVPELFANRGGRQGLGRWLGSLWQGILAVQPLMKAVGRRDSLCVFRLTSDRHAEVVKTFDCRSRLPWVCPGSAIYCGTLDIVSSSLNLPTSSGCLRLTEITQQNGWHLVSSVSALPLGAVGSEQGTCTLLGSVASSVHKEKSRCSAAL